MRSRTRWSATAAPMPRKPRWWRISARGGWRTRLISSSRSRAPSRRSRPRSYAGTSSIPVDALMAATSRPCVPSSRKSAFCRGRTARPCSRAARPRPWWWRRSAPARMSNGSTPCKERTRRRFSCTTISRRSRSARPDEWGAFPRPPISPPFSVGETGRMGGPRRREIGHGKLAWRAIHPILPAHHEFPYTLCVVSDITDSNGSSSMATGCGTSLALMDAGVPLKRPTAGIAMGLILEDKRYAGLSDILGDEDHLGDMDFKVAGTERGVTSLQMDIKIAGITEEIMHVALGQAKEGRLHILGEMNKAIGHARDHLGEHAPRIEQIKIPTDKIREVIGTGGKVIREIVEKTGAKIDIADDGTVKVASANGDAMKAAINWIKALASDPELGQIYDGTVVKVMEFGAFVNFFGAKDGLVHISQLAANRVQKTSDVVKEGDKVKVKLLGFDRSEER